MQIDTLRSAITERVIGQEAVIETVLIGLFSGGHVLLQGLPGLGKTLLVKTMSGLLGLQASRLQCTPDLSPMDIIGQHLTDTDADGRQSLAFVKGPIFTQLLLADEINRALPRTQSALLEAMQEGQVTVRGVAIPLPEPFIMLATQNPVELEGTHPLPEAQLDRFQLKIDVTPPDRESLMAILAQHTAPVLPPLVPLMSTADVLEAQAQVRALPIPPALQDYIVRLVVATDPESLLAPYKVRDGVLWGVSPRGAQSLARGAQARAWMHRRTAVTAEDIQAVARSSLQHRLILNYVAVAAAVRPQDVIDDILAMVPVMED